MKKNESKDATKVDSSNSEKLSKSSKIEEKPSYTKLSNISFILKYIYQWKKSIFVSIGIYSIIHAISPFIWIYVPKILIDEILGEARMEFMIQLLIGTFLVAGIVAFLTEFMQADFRMKMNGVRYNFISLITEKTMKMKFEYTEDSKSLNEMETALQAVSYPRQGIGEIISKLFGLIGAFIGLLGFIIILTKLSPLILALLMCTIVFSYMVTVKGNTYERSRRDDKSFYRRKSRYSTRVLADFKFGKDIRVYQLKDILLAKKTEADEGMIGVRRDVEMYRMKMNIIDAFLFLLREGLIYGYLIYSVINESVTIGEFVMYSVAMNSFTVWMTTVIKDVATILASSMYVNDYRDFLNKEEPSNDESSLHVPVAEQYEIEFDNISFKYPNSERYIFKDFSLKIKKGERLAIVGINGAGKTTLVKLITRLYDPTKGRILLNGIDIKDLNSQEYWDLFSVVFQDVHIFPFTVRENISFTDKNLNLEKFNESLDHSGLRDKINTLEDKEETNMLKILDPKGVELSGGENQKLAMARALYKKGKILIMDEPTAALDPIAEYELYQRFDEMIDNRSAVYISHRLSSTRFCDHIAYIENGELIEYGSHSELINLDGEYAKLFNIQARYYKEEEEAYA